MKIRKVLAKENNAATLVCPRCQTSRKADVSKFRGCTSPLKVKCPCGSTFSVLIEFRHDPRKETDLVGYFCRLPEPGDWGEMVVEDISWGGLKFSALTRHRVRQGDEVKVRFRLKDKKRSEIERTAVVRRTTGDKRFHCAFSDTVEYSKALGFFFIE